MNVINQWCLNLQEAKAALQSLRQGRSVGIHSARSGQRTSEERGDPLFVGCSLKNKMFFIFLREGKGGGQGEKHRCAGETYRDHPGMYPGGEPKQRPFGLQAGAQPTAPHQPGLVFWIRSLIISSLSLGSKSPSSKSNESAL